MASTAPGETAGSRRSRLIAVPMICSTRTVPAALGRLADVTAVSPPSAASRRASTMDPIEGRLERGPVSAARVGGARYRIDLGALGLECLIVEDRRGELA